MSTHVGSSILPIIHDATGDDLLHDQKANIHISSIYFWLLWVEG